MADWLREMTIGEWYQPEDGEPFEIVGLDPKAEAVLVQRFDGTLEEFDFDAWMELRVRPCAPPEDWSGALDVDKEDYAADSEYVRPEQHWQEALDRMDRL